MASDFFLIEKKLSLEDSRKLESSCFKIMMATQAQRVKRKRQMVVQKWYVVQERSSSQMSKQRGKTHWLIAQKKSRLIVCHEP